MIDAADFYGVVDVVDDFASSSLRAACRRASCLWMSWFSVDELAGFVVLGAFLGDLVLRSCFEISGWAFVGVDDIPG